MIKPGAGIVEQIETSNTMVYEEFSLELLEKYLMQLEHLKPDDAFKLPVFTGTKHNSNEIKKYERRTLNIG
jgi:hypothetical protein